MNDSSPLPIHADDAARWPRRYQQVDLVLEPKADAVANDEPQPAMQELVSLDPGPLEQDVADEAGSDAQEFLRLVPEEDVTDEKHPRAATRLLSTFCMRMLQGAVVVNGVALVGLAFVTLVSSGASRTGLIVPAIILGLGLVSAAVSTLVASVNLRQGAARIAPSLKVAVISATGSCAAFALTALSLILVAR